MRDKIEDFEKRLDEIMSDSDMEYFILKEPNHELVKVPFMVWAEWFAENKQLALEIGKNWAVSSIFLGFDHSYHKGGFFFETLVSDGKERDIYRFQTYEECMEFHDNSVWLLKKSEGELHVQDEKM